MNVIPNSLHARDIESILHPQTNLKKHRELGPMLVTHSKGARIFDDNG